MSKSNLKNINALSTTKNPYIMYVNSTYSNLLYKLQKSCAWSVHTNKLFNQSVVSANENTSFMVTSEFDRLWSTYVFIKDTSVRYNPNPMLGLNTTVEVTSASSYTYVDVDILAYFERLAKAERRKQRKLKEYTDIHKSNYDV